MRMVESSHVVKFYGGCLQPKICLVMEYCSNGSLYHLLQRKEFSFEWSLFFRLNIETVQGVLALHTMSPPIVHRDLKSLNLLVNSEYSVKVCDFGVSRYTAGSSDDSTLGKVRGTLAYTAPEIYFGKKFSTKSDVFSLGIIIWEYMARMFTGEYQRPYKEFNFKIDFQILINVAKKGKRPTIPPETPESLKNLITSCWSAEPTDRPETAQILSTLREIQQEYENNKGAWESKLTQSSEPTTTTTPVTKPSTTTTTTTTTSTETNSHPSGGPVWAHKTADQVFKTEDDSPIPESKGKRSITRSASKRILSNLVGGKTSEPEQNQLRWSHKTADEVFINGNASSGAAEKEEPNPKISVTTQWKHTNGDWRDEDAFPDDDDPKKKKKKRGILGLFSGSRKK